MWGSKWFINLFIVAFLVILTGLFLPDEFHIEQSIEINAPGDKVYAAIVDLRKWEQWGTWFQKDSNAVITYDGPDRAIGMRSRWSSEIIGRGSIEITALQFNRQLIYSVNNETQGIKAHGEMRLKPQDNSTMLIWSSRGNVGINIIDRYKLLFFDDKLGKDIQVGLENIKTLVENRIE